MTASPTNYFKHKINQREMIPGLIKQERNEVAL